MLHLTKTFALPLTQVFFVGDVHGRYSLLMTALQEAGFQAERGDQVICAGDLVDGGSENEQVLALLDAPWFHSVLGNHDEFLLDNAPKVTEEQFHTLKEWLIEEEGLLKVVLWLNADDEQENKTDIKTLHPLLTRRLAYWIYNGGAWFFDTYKTLGFDGRRALHAQLKAKQLPLALTVVVGDKRFGVAHAFMPGRVWDNALNRLVDYREEVLWDRAAFKLAQKDIAEWDQEQYTFDDVDGVIFGHNIVPGGEPMVRGNTCFMDTGAKKGRKPAVWHGQQVLDAIEARRALRMSLSDLGKGA